MISRILATITVYTLTAIFYILFVLILFIAYIPCLVLDIIRCYKRHKEIREMHREIDMFLRSKV